VGPGYTIKLTKPGVKVKSLKAGTYKFVISDKSPFHNFTVEKETGAKVEKHLTGTSFTGSKSMTLTLKRASGSTTAPSTSRRCSATSQSNRRAAGRGGASAPSVLAPGYARIK